MGPGPVYDPTYLRGELGRLGHLLAKLDLWRVEGSRTPSWQLGFPGRHHSLIPHSLSPYLSIPLLAVVKI